MAIGVILAGLLFGGPLSIRPRNVVAAQLERTLLFFLSTSMTTTKPLCLLRRTAAAMLLLLLFWTVVAVVRADDDDANILTERVMQLSLEAAKLSALAYEQDIAQYEVSPDSSSGYPGQYSHPDYDEIHFYNEEPDQAIVAKKDGRCYLAFRGTNVNFADWSQNIDLGDVNLYQDNNSTAGGSQSFCEGRRGFADFLNTAVVSQGRADLQTCFESCTLDDDTCVVLTGHSQGGATATQATILLHRLQPTLITFGQPPAVDAGCDLIPSERYFRFVNSKQEQGEDDDLGFDPVVFSPTFVSKSVHYGYFILLGDDPTAVKLLGLDQNYTFQPSFFDRQNEIAAHTMDGGSTVPYSYRARIDALLQRDNFPVPTTGFAKGVFCERSYHELCATGRCGLDNVCADPVTDACVPETCQVDADCATGKCIYDACTAEASGVVEDGCPCRYDRQCRSGDCHRTVTNLDWTCHPKPAELRLDILTRPVLEMTVEAAKLSALAYEVDIAQYAVADSDPVEYQHPDYEEIHFYNEEPDQAIVAKRDGRCYLAFRGTNVNFADWSQNINLGDVDLYQDNNSTTGQFCEGRRGFADFLNTAVVSQGREDLQTCFESCVDPDDCVVLTGHSQGGATATQAGILLYSLNPYTITFGQPPAVDAGCELIVSERFYRFVNSKQEQDEDDDIGFDPVVFSPTFVSKSVHYGYFILLGEDTSAAKLLGLDQNYTFQPSFFDRQNEIAAHTMDGFPYSYRARVESLLNNNTDFPVSSVGFGNGVICERTYHNLCASGRCGYDNACVDPQAELCVKESCRENEDCASGKCIYESCADVSGLVEVDCPCRFDNQCRSGECDQSLLSLDWTCYNTTSAASAVFWTSATRLAVVLVWGFFCG